MQTNTFQKTNQAQQELFSSRPASAAPVLLAVSKKSADKMSVEAEFQTFVDELKVAKLRSEESVRDAVCVISRYQKKFGDSEKELQRLAKAVGVTTRTLY